MHRESRPGRIRLLSFTMLSFRVVIMEEEDENKAESNVQADFG